MIASWQRVFTDLKKFYRKDLSKSFYVLFLITLSDTNHGSRVVWRLYVK